MKPAKLIIYLLSICFSLFNCACQNEYPELGEGIFAEFVTSKDTIVAELFYKKTPLTAANFIALAEGTHPKLSDSLKGIPYYNGSIFHRVINEFMIQGGDPTATGSGSPGYTFQDEFEASLKHDKPGVLSMANSGADTNGSQFFITEVATPWLDNKHSIFGQVVKNLNVIDSISNVKVSPGSNKPLEDINIYKLNIIRQGAEARNYDPVKTWKQTLKEVERQKKLKEEEIKAVAAATKTLIEAYKVKAKTTDSGLMVYTIKKGNGLKPMQGQSVKLLYDGYFSDGKLFGTNVKFTDEKFGSYDPIKEQRGMYTPMSMPFSAEARMIAGFKEGVLGMTKGEKVFLYLPAYLAYGEEGRGPIKPNSDLAFLVEMLEE